MDTSTHNLGNLFKQLGLAHGKSEIEAFLHQHRLSEGQALHQAAFWTEAQAQFLKEALADDSDWTETADELAVLLSS